MYARRLEDLSEDDVDDGLEGDEYESEDDEKEQQLAMQLEYVTILSTHLKVDLYYYCEMLYL